APAIMPPTTLRFSEMRPDTLAVGMTKTGGSVTISVSFDGIVLLIDALNPATYKPTLTFRETGITPESPMYGLTPPFGLAAMFRAYVGVELNAAPADTVISKLLPTFVCA